MSRRTEGLRRARSLGRCTSSLVRAVQPILETLECRQFLSVSVQGETPDFRLIGITGNQQSELTRYTDETLYDIKFATPGTDPNIMDGWHVPPGAAAGIALTTVDSIPGSVPPLSGIRQGSGALRVSIPQNGSAYWGIRSPNVVDLLAAPNDPTDPPDVNRLTFDVTFIARELNGGSFGGGTDDSYTGYAQSNALAINLSDGTWIQKTLAEAGEDDQFLGGGWNNSDVTHQLTWNLDLFTAPDGSLLRDYIKAHSITEARIWVVAQGDEITSPNANGTTGPARIYFDNFRLGRPRLSGGPDAKEHIIGDFDPLYTEKLLTLPFVPDTDAIGFNPEDGLLYRVSGASSYRDDPTRIGYNDNHYMQTVDLATLEQHAIFNGNYEGDGNNGIQGLPAPRPNFVLPVERRTPEQNQPAVGDMYGPGEYHAMRDLTWSSTHDAFFGTDESGIYRLTPSGNSTFVGSPTVGGGGPKGITFATVNGQDVLLVTSRDGSSLVTVDPETGVNTGESAVIMFDALTQELVTGILSLVQAPDGVIYGIRNVRRQGPGDVDNLAFVRDLVTIDPISGEVRSVGALGMHIADLAIAPAAAPATVSEVYVRGSEWLGQDNNATTTNFMEYLETKGLGDDVYGYRLFANGAPTPGPAGNAENVLPWINANQLVVRYTSAPTGSGVPTTGSVTVAGLNAAASAYTVTSVAPVAGDPTAFVLTLSKPLGGGNPTTGAAPTVQENGDQIRLGIPGGGAAGSAFSLSMHVLQGDTDHLDETTTTHAVLARDFAEVKKRFFKDTTSAVTGDGADYSAFHDVDGSGSILARDFAEVKKRFFQTLPPPPAAAAGAGGAGVSITSEVFASGRILG